MLQDMNFSAFGVVGDCIYFSNISFNGLFSMNTHDGTVRFISSFPNENMCVEMLHRSALVSGEKIIFIPYEGKWLNIFDLKKNAFESICLSEESAYYIESYIIDDYLWLMPGKVDKKILKYDMLRNRIEEQNEMSDAVSQLGYDHASSYIVRTAVVNRCIWFALYDSNVLVCIDTEKGELRSKELNCYNIGLICQASGGLWLVPMVKGKLFLFNLYSENIESFDVKTPDIIEGRLINYVFETNNSVFAIPAKGYKIYSKNCGDKDFKVCFEMDSKSINRCVQVEVTTICAGLYKNIWIIPPIKYKKLIIINCENDSIVEMDIQDIDFGENEYLTKVYREKILSGNFLEGYMVDLKRFINLL